MRDHLPKTVLRLSGLILLALLVLNGFRQTFAQTADTLWRPPLNVSQSGTASAPFMVLDAAGTAHLFWQDSLDGFLYTPYRDGEPGIPQPVALPFSTPPFTTPAASSFERLYTPRLAAAEGTLYAVWTNDQQTLIFSRSALANLGNPEAWSSPFTLDTAAVGSQIAVDRAGNLHVAYVKQRGTAEQPAGIYYRRFNEATAQWSSPLPVYTSNYLRAITTEQANVRLAVSDQNQLYLVWDNPLLGMIFFARSTNGGTSWTEPLVIDQKQPGDAPEARGAARVELLARGREVHLTWQAEHGLSGCQQYHQWSVNRGQTWREATMIFSDPLQCPASGELFTSADSDLLFLLTALGGSYGLRVWLDEQWSQPASQGLLSSFLYEATYQQVSLGCVQTAVTPANQWLIIGCSSSAPLDIWLLQRPLGEPETWLPFFPSISRWSVPEGFASSGSALWAPQLLADAGHRFHALWIGGDDIVSAREEQPPSGEHLLYYTSWSDNGWSRRVPLREIPAADQLTAQIKSDDLLAVWRNDAANALLFSQVALSRAVFPGDWSNPQEVVTAAQGVTSPQLLVDEARQLLYLAYAVPFNEGRGVYLLQSNDAGQSWSEPVQVFDAAAANWAHVDSLQLAQTEDGVLHLAWVQYTLAAERRPVGLYYARSSDAGRSWSEPALVVEQPVYWHQITAVTDTTVMRVWREGSAEQTAVWFDKSTNSGLDWERPALILTGTGIRGKTQLLADRAGAVHLLELKSNQSGSSTGPESSELTILTWRAGNWVVADRLAITNLWPRGIDDFAAAVADNGRLTVIYPQVITAETAGAQIQLMSIQRLLHDPVAGEFSPVEPVGTATETAGAAAPSAANGDEAAATPAAVAITTPTNGAVNPIDLLELPEEPPTVLDGNESGGFRIGPLDPATTTGGLLIGAIPAALIVIIALAISLRAVYFKRQ